jgi:hypothetical protein
MSEQNIPTGQYACVLVTDHEGISRSPIVPGNQGELSAELHLYLFAKGSETPFAEVTKLVCIDADRPPNANTTTTPYEFTLIEMRALGAVDDGAVDDAVINALASHDQMLVFPGTPKQATCEVAYKAGSRGTGSFINLKITALKEVTDDARARAIEAAKARKARSAPQATPFGNGGRGAPVTPPGVSPFRPAG